MHPYFKSFSIATTTLLLSLTSSLLPTPFNLSLRITQAQTTQNPKTQADSLFASCKEQAGQGQARKWKEALQSCQQALTIYQKIGNRSGEAETLNILSIAYRKLGQYQKAIELSTAALIRFREINDAEGQVKALIGLGLAYKHSGQHQQGFDTLQQALELAQKIHNRELKSWVQAELSFVYFEREQYQQALDSYQQFLQIVPTDGKSNRHRTAFALWTMGTAYRFLGQFQKTIDAYQQARAIAKEIGQRPMEAGILNSLGNAYRFLGQYQQAIDSYQQALAIAREADERYIQSTSLLGTGNAYLALGQYQQAIDYLNQTLTIARQQNARDREAHALGSLADVYHALGQYEQAIEYFQKTLALSRGEGDRFAESLSMHNLGRAYDASGQKQQAIELYVESLAIFRDRSDRQNEKMALSSIGDWFAEQNQPELAIIFYKQSVNVTEEIRKNIKGLPKELQESYTQTVTATYRTLADLLLKQNRVLEAQQVLDLLKVQELDDYLRNVRGNEQTALGVDYLPNEQQLLTQSNAKFKQIIQLGKELEQLPRENRTQEQEQRKREIEAAQRDTMREFLDFISSPEVDRLVGQLNHTTGRENLDLQALRRLQNNLKQLQQNAVLLYPLILNDRLELILVTPYTPPIRRPVAVKTEDLNRAIAEFRSALINPNSNANVPAQQLYNWLIKPIESALTEANAQTIIYAPDRQLRYIPLAALHDGTRWLVQKYRINNITALSLTEFDTKPQALKILAGAFSQGNYSVQVGDRRFGFGGLPFAGQEVDNLATQIPGTSKLLNSDFSKAETVARMSDYSILHFATHAAFVPSQPEESFILFGNGDRANFRDVETWPLTNVDLVVLSACETGLGGHLGDGREILGFGYLMQRAGAKAAIASLWTVDDGGTQALMNAFYTNLKQGNTTKAEALRQAQIALITGDSTALGEDRGLGVVKPTTTNPLPRVANRLSHPYYWAAFILIGNGL